MPKLALHPTEIRPIATALFAKGADCQKLFAKLSVRSVHYDGLSMASGHDWAVLFKEGNNNDVYLPWLKADPTYLYTLAPQCLCEVGYAPNIPTPLIQDFIKLIQETYFLQGGFALLSGHPDPRLIDLSMARPITNIDMVAMQ